MKLLATIYTGELDKQIYHEKMFTDPEFRDILDGGTLWLDSESMDTGPRYVAGAINMTAHVAQMRAIFGPEFAITVGNYLRLGGASPCKDFCPVAAFRAILSNAVEL